MEIPGNPQNPQKYCCEKCHYNTRNKKDFNKHISTDKHRVHADGNKMEILEIPKIPTYTCMCKKVFKTNSGLWKHKQTCNIINTSDITSLTNLVLEVVKSNNELQKQNQEMQKQILEVCKNGIVNNSVTHVNSHNKTFNLQVFLNEDCKDAMNITDFVNSINLQLSDLEHVGKVGYVEGISNIIIKNLKALDVTKRPVHCTDPKRETIYIKDGDVWEKDEDDNKKLRKMIRSVAFRNCKNTRLFKEKYPDCMKSESRYSDIYNKIIIEVMGGTSATNDIENQNKIMRKIAKEMTIDKSTF